MSDKTAKQLKDLTKTSMIHFLWKKTSGGSRIGEKGGPGIQMPRCRARPEKVAQRGGGGGTPTHFLFPIFFFASFTLWGRGTVRLPDRPPGWGEKQKTKTKNGPKKGGPRPIRPPPLDPPLKSDKLWGHAGRCLSHTSLGHAIHALSTSLSLFFSFHSSLLRYCFTGNE